MRVIDLTARCASPSAEPESRREYELQLPEFVSHYERFWCSESDDYAILEPSELRERVAAIRAQLASSERSLRTLGLPVDRCSAILFVGRNTSNGHAVELSRGFSAWFALERYDSPSQIEVFVPHELCHAAHYSEVPEFYFGSIEEQRSTGRQVVTEGIATRAAMLVGGLSEEEALWADHLDLPTRRAWLDRCREMQADLCAQVLDSWGTAIAGNPLFTYHPASDVPGNRGGYYVALRATIAIEARHGLDISQIARLRRGEVEGLYRGMIREMLSA